MDINLEYYKIFYYVGKEQSITQAAQELAISQPAVSQGIRNLEKQLGSSLFVRTPKGVRFTKEGELLYSYVKRGYECIKQGEEKYKERMDLKAGEICIGASDMTLRFYLLHFLEKFHETYPEMKVKVTNAPTPETVHHLQNGKIDFGVVSTPILEKHQLHVRPVREIQDIFVAGTKFKHLRGKRLSYEELREYPLIFLEENTSTRSYVDEFLKSQKVLLTPEFELATSDMLVQFAEKGLGIACVVDAFAEEKIQSGELFQLEFETSLPRREIAVLTDDKIPLSVAAKALLSLMLG